MATRFSEAYETIQQGLANKGFSTDKGWQDLITRARKFAGVSGFDVGEASLVSDLHNKLASDEAEGTNEAVLLYRACGERLSGTGPGAVVDADLGKRLGALKTIRHVYLLKRFGGHKIWCLAIPTSFSDWPCNSLMGSLGGVTTKLNDKAERFTLAQRKDLSHASQHALKWVHKAMIVAGNPGKNANFERVARWFADANSKDEDITQYAQILNAGLKKIASKLKSGHLIYTDSVSERGTNANAGTEAFVWGDPMDVVYIEDEFFGTHNTLTGLTNWTRIVVHELTHREAATQDHAYEHQGINPRKLSAAKAIENADSWAWFCADCAGALADSVIQNALARQ